MAKLSLKGFVSGVGEVEVVGEKGTRRMFVVLNVPGYTNEFGEKKGKDQHWLIAALNDNIEKFKLGPDLKDKKAEITFYCESIYTESKQPGKEGEPQYFVNNTLAEFKLL